MVQHSFNLGPTGGGVTGSPAVVEIDLVIVEPVVIGVVGVEVIYGLVDVVSHLPAVSAYKRTWDV